MSDNTQKAEGSGSEASMPFISVDIPANFERAATAYAGSGGDASMPPSSTSTSRPTMNPADDKRPRKRVRTSQ